ncbi:hypothetical protein HYU16_02920 [Candidatus Woesearchaeota archaeon]|nr:hypothetical protein [Candidatus Woesearchaeota archaeon]
MRTGFGSGKRGAGWGWLLGAVLMALVIFTVPAVKNIAYGALENTLKIAGIDIGNPRIGAFSAKPVDIGGDGKIEMRFELSVAGNKDSAYLEIYESKASDDKTAAQLEPPPAKFGDDDRIYSTRRTEGRLSELAKKGVFSINCPGHDECKAFDYVPKPRDEFKPGLYRFTAVIRKAKDNKVVYSKDVVAGFYDEEYVELLDKPAVGCPDCNVIECKRKQMETLLEEKDKCSEGVKILYKESGGRVNVVDVNGCAFPIEPVKHTDPLTNAEFTGCLASQINLIHSQTVLSAFYRIACEKGDGIGALTDLPLAEDKLAKKGLGISQVKEMAKDFMQSCSKKAESYLNGKGWFKAETAQSRRAAYDDKITSYLDNKVMPGVTGVSLNNDQTGLLVVSWKALTGQAKVGKFVIEHVVTKAIDPESKEVQTFGETLEKLPSELTPAVDGFSFTIRPENSNLAGWHEFIVSAVSKDDPGSSSVKSSSGRGLYNLRFLELYQTHPKGCTDDKCNVIKKKKEMIKSSPGADEAYMIWSGRIKNAGCVYDEKKGMDDCPEPEAVDIMYRGIIGLSRVGSDFEKAVGMECGASNTPEGRVCSARKELKAELEKRGWFQVVVETPIVITPSNVKVQDFKAVARADGGIDAEFVVSGNVAKISGFAVEHRFNRFYRDDSKQFVNLLPMEVAKDKREVVIGPFEERFDGYHKFRLKAVDDLSIELSSSAEVAAGFYTQGYLDFYDGDAENCKGDGGCDVVGRKRDYLKEKRDAAIEVFANDEAVRKGLEFFGCSINGLDRCRPEGVQALFAAVLGKFYPNTDQQNELLTKCETKGNPYVDICKARKNLESALKSNGWVEVTKPRAETKAALPTTTADIKTVPERPLPGELFTLVVEAASSHAIRWLKIAEGNSKEWKTVPCDWLSKTCKREWSRLYFDPNPVPIRIAVVDATERVSELEPFTPSVAWSCLGSKKAGEKWVGCKTNDQEEVLYECNSDGSFTTHIPEKEEDRKPSSFLCGGIVDYGQAETGSQGNCIYTCKFDAECSAVGGSIAPFECPGKNTGMRGVELKQVCCEVGAPQEVNPKTVGVLSIITNIMNENLIANSVGGFFFVFDLINPVKMFTESEKSRQRQDLLDIMLKLQADAEQGTSLSSVVGAMGTLKKDEKERKKYLDQKYQSISNQFYSYAAKLEIDAGSDNKAKRDRARATLAELNPVIANFNLYTLPQREFDELAIRHSTDPLVLQIARYDALTWLDDDRQFEALDDIYFEVGKSLEKTKDEGMAVEMYNLVLENFRESEHAQESRDRIELLQSFRHKAGTLTQSLAIDIFGDPTFYVFGGPKALIKGGLTAVRVLSKTPQIAAQTAKQAGKVSEPLLREALASSGVKSREILEKAPGMLVRSGGKVSQELVELLANVPRVIKSRMIKTVVDREGRVFFETTALKGGQKIRVPYLESFKTALAVSSDKLGEFKKAYRDLMIEKGHLFGNPNDQKLAIRLLQSGLDKDEVVKVLTKADKIADDYDLLTKVVNNFMEPEFGITQPRLVRMILAAKATPASVEDALSIKRAATEVILKNLGNNRNRFLVAKTPGGQDVKVALNRQLMKGDLAGEVEKAGSKYAEVMSKYPNLLDNADDQKRVLDLVQAPDLGADDIGHLITRRANADSAIKQGFLDSYVKKIAPTLDRINDADEILKAQDFTDAIRKARIDRAKVLKQANKRFRGIDIDIKMNELLQQKLAEAALRSGRAAKIEGAISGDSADLSKTFYGAFGPMAEGRGAVVVPEHVPTFFNRLVAIKNSISDFAISSEIMAGVASEEAKLVVKTLHAHAIEYGAPVVKLAREKGLRPLNAIVSFDISKASMLSPAKFAELDEVAGVVVPVIAQAPDGTDELAFVVFENGAIPAEVLPQTDLLFLPDGSAPYCAYYDVVVECTLDDEVSRSAMPTAVFGNNLEKQVLISLNMRNLEGFETTKDDWLKDNIAPLAANVEVNDEALSDAEADAALTEKADELLGKAGTAYDTSKQLRANGLSDVEVQQFLVSAKDLSAFNDLKDVPVESLRVRLG